MRVAVSLWPTIRKTTRTKTKTTSVRVVSSIVTLLVVVLSLLVNRARAAVDDDQQQPQLKTIGKNTQAMLSRELDQQLVRSILKNNTSQSKSQFANDLVSFQTNLVRKRNAQCLFEKHKRFEWSSVVLEKYNISHFYSLLNNQTAPNLPPHSFNSFLDELNKKV